MATKRRRGSQRKGGKAGKRREPRDEPGVAARAASEAQASPPTPSPSRRLLPFGLAALSGALYFVGFAGFDVWPLALVCFIPLFAAFDLERERGARLRRLLALGFVMSFVKHAGGFYWLIEMLEDFSGFGFTTCVLLASLYFASHAIDTVLLAWLYDRGRRHGWPVTPVAVAAVATYEMLVPTLFPNYLANSFHEVPVLCQVADLGGPVLVSMICVAVNGAIYEVGRAAWRKERIGRVTPAVVGALVVAQIVYGVIRIAEVDARAAEAPTLSVGLVQTNMGIFEKRDDPDLGHERHVDDTLALEREHDLDLIVWPESAYNRYIHSNVTNLRRYVMAYRDDDDELHGPIRTPLLFGGLSKRPVGDSVRRFNTAYLIDERGRVQGTYDKTFLLMFGEYLPLADRFPVLHEWSPRSGRFTPGDHVRPLPFGRYRLTALVCYEDVAPRFTRDAVREGDPHLLVNVTNDAWFGDTTEPWIHLALAKMRAIEHHRFLVRSTNSGVSAVVDPVGRLIVSSGVMTRETLVADVGMMRGAYPYEHLGDWPGWLGVALCGLFTFRRRGTR